MIRRYVGIFYWYLNASAPDFSNRCWFFTGELRFENWLSDIFIRFENTL